MLFLKTVFAIAKGPGCFPELMKRSPLRALFHLLLFLILVSACGTAVQSRLLSGDLELYEKEFTDSFGSMIIRNGIILPEKSPEQPRAFILKRGILRFDYLTKESLDSLTEIPNWSSKGGILWIPSGLRVWMNMGDGNCFCFPLMLPASASMMETYAAQGTDYKVNVPLNEMIDGLKQTGFPSAGKKDKTAEKVPFSVLFDQAETMIYTVLFLGRITGFLFLTLMTVLIFSVVQYIFRAGGLEKLTYGNILSLLVYTSFPALFAGTAAGSFSIPYLDGETVFFAVFFFYHIMSLHAVRKSMQP